MQGVKRFYRKNGAILATFMLVSVTFWVVLLVVLPQIIMIDFSLRPNLPPASVGGPDDVYTLEHYRYLLFGRGDHPSGWNAVELGIFARTLVAAVCVTLMTLLISYPIAYYIAQIVRPGWSRMMIVVLVIPFWINDILRAYALRIIFGDIGVMNSILKFFRLIDAPIDFIRSDVALFSGLVYAYLLLMIFPIYSAIESLDRQQIEAARDLGASWWRIHQRIVIPFASGGITSGCVMVFMLSSGALILPQVLGGPSRMWFTELICQNFFETLNWARGAAYAMALLLATSVILLLFIKLLRVRIGEVIK